MARRIRGRVDAASPAGLTGRVVDTAPERAAHWELAGQGTLVGVDVAPRSGPDAGRDVGVMTLRWHSVEVDLRPAREDEGSEIAELWLRSRMASVPAIPPPVHTTEEVRAWFRDVVLPERQVVVAESDGSLVGLLVIDGDRVDQLYVEPSWTSTGVGSRLLDIAKARRPGGLQLWTFQSNDGAKRFYERHGFVAVEATAGDNEEGAPAVRYEWRCEPDEGPP